MQLQDPAERLKQQCRGYTVGDVLQIYLDDFIDVGNFGRSKLATIKALINRPNLADMDAMKLRWTDILDYLRRHLKMPLGELVLLAIFSARRQEEITKLRWDVWIGSDSKTSAGRQGPGAVSELLGACSR